MSFDVIIQYFSSHQFIMFHRIIRLLVDLAAIILAAIIFAALVVPAPVVPARGGALLAAPGAVAARGAVAAGRTLRIPPASSVVATYIYSNFFLIFG